MAYLITRPISASSRAVEPYLDRLQAASKLDALTLKQKFTGNALTVLLMSNDTRELEAVQRELKRDDIKTVMLKSMDAANKNTICSPLIHLQNAYIILTRFTKWIIRRTAGCVS